MCLFDVFNSKFVKMMLNFCFFLLSSACSDPSYLIAIDIPSRWLQSPLTETNRSYSMRHVTLIDDEKTRKFMVDIGDPVSRLDGDSIPISKVSIVRV